MTKETGGPAFPTRRAFLLGLTSALAAPAIVRADSLMKIVAPKPEVIIPYLEPVLGWVPCDGRLLHRALYAELFKVIGTSYGDGDGLTTFRAPYLAASFIYERPDRSISFTDPHGAYPSIALRHEICAAPPEDGFIPVGTIGAMRA